MVSDETDSGWICSWDPAIFSYFLMCMYSLAYFPHPLTYSIHSFCFLDLVSSYGHVFFFVVVESAVRSLEPWYGGVELTPSGSRG